MNFEYDDDADEAATNGNGNANGTQTSVEMTERSDAGEVAVATTTTTTTCPPASVLSLPKKSSEMFGASSNLSNSIVGAGIIGIPYAFRTSGLGAGLVLLVLVAVLTDKSLRILIEQASFHPRLRGRSIRTYEDLMSYPFGKFGSAFVLTCMFILAYGAMVAYLLIIKDTVPTVLGYEPGTNTFMRNIIMLVTSLAIMVPLSLQRDMASLSKTSAASVLADIILVGFVAACAPIKEAVSNAGGLATILKNDGIEPTLFVGLGILSTAMACQHSAFIVAGSLKNPTKERWATVTSTSIGLSGLLCATLGACGYLGYLGQTQGDILNNFPQDSNAAHSARVLLAITMFFTYPMESFVARHVLIMLLHKGDMDNSEGNANTLLCLNRRHAWTLAIYLLSLVPALLVSDIGPVLSLTGAVGGSCISYIAPGMLYLGLNGEALLEMSSSKLDDWRRIRNKKRRTGDQNDNVTENDLPIQGNAALGGTAPGASTPNSNQNESSSPSLAGETIEPGPKPLWWYLALLPIWRAIAKAGATHMNERLAATTTTALSSVDGGEDGQEEPYVLPPPSWRDFAVCFFFILFGLVSAVAGVVSNIYMLLSKVDYT